MADHDWKTFTRQLAGAIAAELEAQRATLEGRTLRSVALDVHPWHGRIGLSVLTDVDPVYPNRSEQRQDMAGWRFFDFHRGEPWPRAKPLQTWLRAVSAEPLDETGAPSRGEAANLERHGAYRAAFVASAAALDDASVSAVLATFQLSSDFERFVGDPDDGDFRNFCRE